MLITCLVIVTTCVQHMYIILVVRCECGGCAAIESNTICYPFMEQQVLCEKFGRTILNDSEVHFEKSKVNTAIVADSHVSEVG